MARVEQAELRRHIEAFYPAETTPEDAFLVWSWPGADDRLHSRWFQRRSMGAALACATRQNVQTTLYLNLGLRHPSCRPSLWRRGGASDVYVVPGLWADLDDLRGKHQQAALPRDADVTLDFLMTLSASPSLIVDSGGGTYVYHLFDVPFIIRTEDHRAGIKRLLKRYNHTILQLARTQHGWEFDTLGDLPRLFRPAGSLNHKYSPPRPVTVVHETGLRYGLDSFGWLLDMPQPGNVRREHDVSSGTLDLLALAEHYGATLTAKSEDREHIGTHPIHGSSTGTNLHINPTQQQWYCWRHNTGGDALYFLAVCERLLDCSEVRAGAFATWPDTYLKTVQVANERFGAGIELEVFKQDAPRANPRRSLRERAVVRRPTLHVQAISAAEVQPWH